ncbi:hypothetical protein CEXT_705941 [Caerostris extrusa]|uniref:Uncharacterized protein n=1 Tax=Caerostris extrusa TaxID=172846 RepID=A0AAV4Q2A7_CAEEX|nr:hypothetical protein CEXT_705941 [Caerostris extrusa]
MELKFASELRLDLIVQTFRWRIVKELPCFACLISVRNKIFKMSRVKVVVVTSGFLRSGVVGIDIKSDNDGVVIRREFRERLDGVRKVKVIGESEVNSGSRVMAKTSRSRGSNDVGARINSKSAERVTKRIETLEAPVNMLTNADTVSYTIYTGGVRDVPQDRRYRHLHRCPNTYW